MINLTPKSNSQKRRSSELDNLEEEIIEYPVKKLKLLN